MSHLLLVEDDPAHLHLLQATVAFGGFTSSQAVSADEALGRIDTESFDAVLLGLAVGGGLQLVEAIRSRSDCPLIIISGRFDWPAMLASVDAGADDFVAKPFMPGELLARIRLAIRRHARPDGERANAAAWLLQRPKKSSAVEPAAKPGTMADRLISFLHSREPEVVMSGEIISAMWGAKEQRTQGNLRVLVAKARTRLDKQFRIANEHGRGYRIIPSLGPQGQGDPGPPTGSDSNTERQAIPPVSA